MEKSAHCPPPRFRPGETLRGFIVRRVEAVVGAERPGAVVLLTDAAMLHPYVRSRLLESRLHDKVKVPTILFYPGRRSGQYGLHFLGFYPVDGNYRASLIGGNA